jgi:hypothetical protein
MTSCLIGVAELGDQSVEASLGARVGSESLAQRELGSGILAQQEQRGEGGASFLGSEGPPGSEIEQGGFGRDGAPIGIDDDDAVGRASRCVVGRAGGKER